MNGDVIEGEAIEETGVELVHAGGTLIRSDNPAAFLSATVEIAEALARVVRQQGLVSVISGKEHCRVEAWTLLGSMLGVFPVVEWTRPIADGWEARVVAKTLAGETVGAAEAMCSRSEKTWSKRDDYALRSMAQTRATSKAMRGPLGFVMTLAGFEATPEEEMPDSGHQSRSKAQEPFDPATDLLPGAPRGESFARDCLLLLEECHPRLDWPDVIRQVVGQVYGVERMRDIPTDGFKVFATRLANACAKVKSLFDPNMVPPLSDENVRAAFAWAFDGAVVEPKEKAAEPVEQFADLPEFGAP